jgi:hypothetical protein
VVTDGSLELDRLEARVTRIAQHLKLRADD